ncbi:MAG TPA: hypothetical protein DCL21_05640 [Alphaproteobacteria bacterium]|nr:hypothetical protein [Alphaproteobacteria bacterium]
MFKKSLILVAGSFTLAACAPQQPMVAPEVQQISYQTSVQGSELAKLSDRVRRVERAMIRLDTRMKLVERNELARFTANQQKQTPSVLNQAGYKPTSFTTTNDIVNFAKINSPFAKRVQPSYTASSMQSKLVTSSLQVAPKPVMQAKPQHQLASANNVIASLPSLADTSASMQEKDVSIWTIEYTENKIWPTRDQLAESKSVVDLLRSETPVAVFARGANPSSKEFRERVRALSRYLGKVANSQDVAIAAMPASHLDSDTIELLVAK